MRRFPAALVFLLFCAAAHAQQNRDIGVSGQAGWSARVTRGEWAPVLVDLDNIGQKDVDANLVVAWGFSGIYQGGRDKVTPQSLNGRTGPLHRMSVSLPSGSRKRVYLTLLAPDQENLSVWAFVLSKNRQLSAAELLARPTDERKRIVAVVGADRPAGLPLPGIELVNVPPDRLPEEWQGYACLEALVWLDGKATEIRSPAQMEALRTWVAGGGHLVVARASEMGITGTPVADLLPVKLGVSRPIDQLSALPVAPVGAQSSPKGQGLMLETTVRSGKALLREGELPLIVQAPHGGGRVTFIAFDPSRPPFEGWKEASTLWRWLLGEVRLPPPSESGREMKPPALIGSTALAQISGRFPDVAPPAIGGLFLLIILYLLVVGPLDYVALRLFKRLELTWFTFPAYVVAFTGLILLIGGAFMRSAAHQREVAVVDHYPEAQFTRQRAIGAILAPSDVVFGFQGGEPISANFLTRSFFGDTSGELTGVTIAHGRAREVRDWVIQRGATGLALSDRCATGACPLAYRIDEINADSVAVNIVNSGSVEYESALFVAPSGVYRLLPVRKGEQTMKGSRVHPSFRAFAEAEGDRPQRGRRNSDDDGASFYDRHNRGGDQTLAALDQQAKRILVGLSFPPPQRQSDDEALTGIARSLNAARWIESGGTVLLAWPVRPEAQIAFDPTPKQRSTVVLTRVFQGPRP